MPGMPWGCARSAEIVLGGAGQQVGSVVDTDESAGTGHGDVGTTGNLHGDVRGGRLDGFLADERVSLTHEDRVLTNETKCLGDLFGRYFCTPMDEPGAAKR